MELYDLTAAALAREIADGKLSSVEATQAMLDRIAAVEPKVDALLHVDRERALERAGTVQGVIDRRRKNGEVLPPLAGVPIVLKDNICTRGMPTTCASRALENFVPPYNATVVEKLEAGLTVTLGKTNMDEFAMGSSCEFSAFKFTHNPWSLDRVPGGSSGGSAAAVAACEAPLSLASDTGGSIRMPASFCGVTGLKPTYGAVSRYGVVAFASSLDQVGTIGRSAEDCALLFDQIRGQDPLDSTSANIDFTPSADTLNDEIGKLRIGLPVEYFAEGVAAGVRAAVLEAVKVYESMGATVEEISIPVLSHALSAYYLISSAEASSNLARFDGVRYGYRSPNATDGEDFYVSSRSESFGFEVKRRIMLGTYALCSGYYDEYYNKALKVRAVIKAGFEKAFEQYDLLLSPTSATTAFKKGELLGDMRAMYQTDLATVSVNIAGLPGISIPCGFVDGLPVGLQLIGRHFAEGSLLQAAHAYQQVTDFHSRRPAL